MSAPLVKPAKLKGYYACFSLLGKDYLALIEHDETSAVDGLLLFPQDKSQRKKLDDFEGEAYTMTPVQVTVVGEEGQMVDADMYLWNGERDAVSVDRWDLDTFIRERLNDWIELFAGMELLGDVMRIHRYQRFYTESNSLRRGFFWAFVVGRKLDMGVALMNVKS